MQIEKINRRSFISSASKAALGLAVAPFLYNSRLFGGEMANNKLNIACIGLGGQMNNLLLPDLSKFQDKANIIAICDLDPVPSHRKHARKY